MKEQIKHTFITAAIMIAFTAVGTILLAGVFNTAKAPIAANEREARLQLFEQVLPKSEYNNDLLKDAVEIAADESLGQHKPSMVYRARLNGEAKAVIMDVIAPDGYSGQIKMLVAIRVDGSVAGVRVVVHKETPGLGDYIDLAHGDWIKKFDGLSLSSPTDEGWHVKKDGGKFDYMTGATITPRAVIKAVNHALHYFADHREMLLAANA